MEGSFLWCVAFEVTPIKHKSMQSPSLPLLGWKRVKSRRREDF